jgi:predicted nucleotide-binding protein
MAINQELFAKLKKKLGVGQARVYERIQKIALRHHVSNHVASLSLAADSGIPYRKYSTPDDRAELRAAFLGHVPVVQPGPAPTPTKPSQSRAGVRPKAAKDNSIFVVHGRDAKLTEDMYALLRALGLAPVEWSKAISQAKGANPNVGDVVNKALKRAQGILVLLSPDEDAKLQSKFCSSKDKRDGLHRLQGQPRPNVILEAGIALGVHSDKTLLVQVGDVRDISDMAGKHILHLSNKPASRKELAQRLRKLGFKVDTIGDTWLTVGNFDR